MNDNIKQNQNFIKRGIDLVSKTRKPVEVFLTKPASSPKVLQVKKMMDKNMLDLKIMNLDTCISDSWILDVLNISLFEKIKKWK